MRYLGYGLLIFLIIQIAQYKKPKAEQPWVDDLDRSDAAMSTYLDVANAATTTGLVYKVEKIGGGLVSIWTGRDWDSAPIDQKHAACLAIYAVHAEKGKEPFIVDSKNGKRIGFFSVKKRKIITSYF